MEYLALTAAFAFLLLSCAVVAEDNFSLDFATEYSTRTRRSIKSKIENTSTCPQTSFEFPNTEQLRNYIQIKTPIPDLDEFTVCFWFKAYAAEYDTWVSYGNTHTHSHAFVIRISATTTHIDLNGRGMGEEIPISINKEHHVCFATFMSSSARSYMFLDGQLADTFHGLPDIIRGGGVFILGQLQQGSSGLGTSSNPRFSAQGIISNFMLWDRVLSHDEYKQMYQDRCSCPLDYVVSLEKENIDVFGGISALPPHICRAQY